MATYNIFSEPPVTIWINKPQLEQLVAELPKYAKGNWKHISSLQFEYDGIATLYIPHTEDSWRKTIIQFGDVTTVKLMSQEDFTKTEIDKVLDDFFENVLDPYCKDHRDLRITREGKDLEIL